MRVNDRKEGAKLPFCQGLSVSTKSIGHGRMVAYFALLRRMRALDTTHRKLAIAIAFRHRVCARN